LYGGITVHHQIQHSPVLMILSAISSTDRQESSQLGFTYVQGMNVLAAPFLYTMPSEIEAFWCFSKFIEESCPLYVQPTLEGVHRGLKVRSHISASFVGILNTSPAPGSMSQNRRSGFVCSSALKEFIRRDLCIPMYVVSFVSTLPF
jgi:hypothetical protein